MPSCVHRSTGAQAQPGWAASTVTASRSGCSRRSPTGPPMCRPDVIESSTRNTSWTGDMPTPQAAAAASRSTGTVFARVTPALSTQVMATARTPAAASRPATTRPAASSARRSSSVRSMPGLSGLPGPTGACPRR
ncbi:hypothetical protein ACFQX7_38325 [Luedemannella flava]